MSGPGLQQAGANHKINFHGLIVARNKRTPQHPLRGSSLGSGRFRPDQLEASVMQLASEMAVWKAVASA